MDAIGWIFIAVIAGVLPLLAIHSARSTPKARPTLVQVLVSVLIAQGVCIGLAHWAASSNAIALFPSPSLGWKEIAFGIGFIGVMLGINMARWRMKGAAESEDSAWLTPRRPRDLAPWLLISLAAGIGEEIAYRGVLPSLLSGMVGGWWPACAISIIAFALGHWVQGWSAMAIVIAMAAAMHVLVWLSGDLYMALAVHAVYNFAAGAQILWLKRRDAAR